MKLAGSQNLSTPPKYSPASSQCSPEKRIPILHRSFASPTKARNRQGLRKHYGETMVGFRAALSRSALRQVAFNPQCDVLVDWQHTRMSFSQFDQNDVHQGVGGRSPIVNYELTKQYI